MSKIAAIQSAVETGKKKLIRGLIEEALQEGHQAVDILNKGMIDAMSIVGDKFKNGELFVPEMLVAARAMKEGVELLKPFLTSGQASSSGTFIIGTVEGDLHDIGKNLVAMMIESAGFKVIDLGVDVAPERFVEAIKVNPDCHLVGLSALLTTTMPSLEKTINAINESGLRNQVKIMVGGAPISQEIADEVGADAFAADAATAASIAKELAAGA
ncbi:corrinoid protein [Desulfitobacterium chlororespirans]|uniref:Methylmalonyl-CoA mutase C-terminal domain-containing protein/methyltransferase cognate corrinoid proteins n=1 Tax=Desulfitobacterium chlororespirans DSM 11544 TaxID=1121395 RepID=A0A1M7UBG3_9FIRM|nr:corrinoid protein [Desulfitobacterium chlororespirans]SHN80349.1 methylmalonyl-CoA mutase C-terminal domain-containing protein/methyltransferase cognate corrinoid proteins [Desulfitobacterium chlororespirans DSM 11544]